MQARRTRSGGPYAAIVTLVVLGLWSVPVSGQPETFEDSSDVVLIEVPVNVVSRNGTPIRGLTKESFAVFDNGREQEILNVETIDLAAIAPERKDLPRELDRLPAVARRHFLLLFDLSFSSPNSIIRAREAAHQFVLNSLHPTDLASVATFSLEHGPRLLVTFTPDRAQLGRAIDTLGVSELLARGLVVDPLRFMIENPIYSSADGNRLSAVGGEGDGSTAPQALYEAFAAVIAKQADRAQKSYERRRISAWSRSLSDMARALASVEGRKHVVYFSEGFDGRLLLGRAPDPTDGDSLRDQRNIDQGFLWMVDNDDRFGNPGLMRDVDEMLEQFRRADSVIQAVDIGGLRAGGAGSVGDTFTQTANVGQDALFYVAHETGGMLFEDANDLSTQLTDLLEHTSVTYVLSFYPDKLKLDGDYHRLKVKTKDLPRGARLSHRPGYYAPRNFEDLHPLEKALLASEAIASATPRKEVKVNVLVAPFRASNELAYVPVIIEIDGGTLLTGQKSDELGIEVYTYATNSQGEMRDFFSQVVQLDLRSGRREISATGVKYYGHLELTPDDYLIRVLIRNDETGRVGVESVRLKVPPYADMEPELLPPFFVEQPGRWVMVRERGHEGRGGSVVYPFIVNGEPYVPAAKPQLAGDETSQLCLVAYNFGDGELELESTVLSANGNPFKGDGALAMIERTVTGLDGVDKVLATFNPRGMQKGEYTLQVSLTNRATGSTQINSIPFAVN